MKNLQFTIQGKGVFWITFLISTLLSLLMVITGYSSLGFTILEIGVLYIFVAGFLNIIIALTEFYDFFSDKENGKIHRNSALLILLNFPIGFFYFFLIVFLEKFIF